MRAHPPTIARTSRLLRPALFGLGLWGAVVLPLAPVGAADLSRASGRLQSLDPASGTMSLQEIGRNGVVTTRSVRFSDATVVRATRRHDRPGEWRESPTHVLRWPMGTFMTAIGVRTAGTLEAFRIEIPAIE